MQTAINPFNSKSQKGSLNNRVKINTTLEQYLPGCLILNPKIIIMSTLELKGDDSANGEVEWVEWMEDIILPKILSVACAKIQITEQ